jgi:hypothetical protein
VQVLPSDESVEASAAMSELTARLSPGNRRWPDAIFEDRDRLWQAIAAAEWPLVGVPDEASFSLTDLSEIVESWGRRALPVPFTPTVLVRRWSWASGVPAERPLTFGLASGAEAYVPFADFPEVALMASDGEIPYSRLDLAIDQFDSLMPASLVPASLPDLTPAQVTDVCALALAEAIGVADGVLSDTIEYARSREQFGRAIGTFQAVKHHCANMHIDIEIARSALGWVVTEPAAGMRPGLADAFARVRRAVEVGLQVHGAMGFTWEAGLHFGLRHVVGLGELATRAAPA